MPMFFFSERVWSPAERFVSLLIFIIAVLTLVFGDEDVPAGDHVEWWWVPATLAVEAGVRLFGLPTPLTLIATVTLNLLAFLFGFLVPSSEITKATWRSLTGNHSIEGAGRQLAVLATFVLSVMATAIYHVPSADNKERRVIAKVLLALAAAVELTEFLGLRLGQRVVDFLRSKGLLEAPRTRSIELTETTAKPVLPSPTGAGAGAPASSSEAKDDAEAPSATDDLDLVNVFMKRPISASQFNFRKPESKTPPAAHVKPIKHFRPSVFSIPAGLASLALAFFTTDFRPDVQRLGTPKEVWQVITLVAIVVFGICCFLQLIQAAMYPSKVIKHWQNPIFGPMFGLIPICVSILTILGKDEISQHAYTTLVWSAAVGQMLFSLAFCSRWYTHFQSKCFLTPSMLIAPLGLFISAIALQFDATVIRNPLDAAEAAGLFFYTGFFIMLIITPVLTYRLVIGSPLIPDVKHSGLIFPAAFGAAAIAAAISGEPLLFKLSFYSFVWFYALFLVVAVRSFTFNLPVTEAWLFLFPFGVSASAFNVYAVMRYNPAFFPSVSLSPSIRSDSFFGFVSWVNLGIASFVALCLIIHTIYARFFSTPKDIFQTVPKWGPMSIMKIMHVALRCAVKKLNKIAENLKAAKDGPARAKALKSLRTQFGLIKITHEEHAMAEETIMFPCIDAFFPGIVESTGSSHEHERDEVFLKDLETQMSTVAATLRENSDADVTDAISAIADKCQTFQKDLMKHFNGEESRLQPVGRKFWSLDLTITLHRRIFAAIPLKSWRIMIPFILNSAPKLKPRLRFLLAIRWGSPEFIQMAGKIAYETLSDEMWAPLAEAIPELIPRTIPGHFKQA